MTVSITNGTLTRLTETLSPVGGKLPSEVTVTGCSDPTSYNSTTGEVVLTGLSNTVGITAAAIEPTATFNLAELSLSVGVHTISVSSSATGYRESARATQQYTVYGQCSTPIFGIQDNGHVVYFTTVAHASSYTIYVDGNAAQTGITGESSYFDLDILGLATGSYSVQIKAIGGGYYTDSELSTAVTYTVQPQLVTPTNVAVSGTTVEFDEVTGATSYDVLVDGVSIGSCAPAAGFTVTVAEGGTQGGSFELEYADDHSTSWCGRGTYSGVYSINDYQYTNIMDPDSQWDIDNTQPSLPYVLTSDAYAYIASSCLAKGTPILLADRTTKNIEDITYDDELLVWDFYQGQLATAKPVWIMKPYTESRSNLVTFSNGAQIKFIGAGEDRGYHRIYNDEAQAFTHTGAVETPDGTTTYCVDGTHPTIVSQVIVEEPVQYYNVITDKHYNLFANGILTSCRLSNRYKIQDMKYTDEVVITEEEVQQYFENIADKKQEVAQ